MSTIFHWRTLAPALALAMFTTTAAAAPPVYKYGAGHIMARLAQDAQVHTEALHLAASKSTLEVISGSTRVPIKRSGRFMGELRSRSLKATISAFDYVPNNPEAPSLRVHSRSGTSTASMFRSIARPINEGSSSGSESEAGRSVSDMELQADAADSQFYPASTDIRAANLRQRDIWVVEPSPELDGRIIHGTDAELKALRQLELEFVKNPALRVNGGTLTGYVSRTVCPSCRAAMQRFSKKYGVDVTTYQLDEVGLPTTASLQETVINSADVAIRSNPGLHAEQAVIDATQRIENVSKASSKYLLTLRKNINEELLMPASFKVPGGVVEGAAWSDAYTIDRITAAEEGKALFREVCAAP